MRMVFAAPTGPGFSTNPRALQLPAEELMMWDGIRPALTNSAAATAWMMALHPPPQNTNTIFPYLFVQSGMRMLQLAVLDEPAAIVHSACFWTERIRPDGHV